MVWNIEFQVAALLLTFVIAGMCLGQKRLNFAAERAFLKLLMYVIVSIVLDISSSFAIQYRNEIGDTLCEVINKLYLLSICIVACQSAWFAVAEIRYTFKKFWVNITAGPLVIEALVLSFFPYYRQIEGGVYDYGVPIFVTYGVCALYIISNIIMIVLLRDKINTKRRSAIYFWMVTWFVFGGIQFFTERIVLVSFAMAIACVYMYCKLENPEYHLDFATNVFNAKGFEMIMNEHLSAREHKSLITMEVGDMGMVNEIFGAHAVEKVIVAISEFADGIPNSTLFRLEDNLFCLSIDSSEEAERAIEQIIKRFSLPWVIGGITLDISVSLSYIKSIDMFANSDELVEIVSYFAQESLKRPTGEILAVNEEELHLRQRNLEMQHALEWAFRNDGIEVFYQPIYNIAEGRFSGMEALARMKDEKGNIVMPVDFIEFAERNGMVLKLGEIIFRKVCEFMQRMHVEDYGIDIVEVNLSVVQCMQEDLSRMLKNIMGEYQIPPYRINFEITETAAINSKRTIDRNMKDLIAYGSGFSLDDYGSGYSNLAYVVSLPLKMIKLDKMLVDSYFTSEKVKIATEYTIEMLHKLGMQIIVEGIENEEQYLAFKKLGVEYIQGYYFSKPLSKDNVLSYIKEWL